jgi:HEAT repeat protein
MCGVAVLLLCACDGAARQRRQLLSQYPLDRARAAVQLAELGDHSAIHALVNLLEDDDRAVRMYTIVALKRLCGEDHGYHYYDPQPQRAAAVARWRDALRRGAVTARRADAGTTPPATRPSPIQAAAGVPAAEGETDVRGDGRR